MSYKKFKSGEIFDNVIITYPKFDFFIHSNKVYLNKDSHLSGDFSNKIGHTLSSGYVSLHEININRPSDSLVHPFITKEGSRTSFKTVSTSTFNSSFAFGDKISGKYPYSASISRVYIPQGEDYQPSTFMQPQVTDTDNKKFIMSLKGPIKQYTGLSKHFEYSSSLGNKGFQKVNLIGIPSIFYGSSVKRGSIILRTYVTGTLCSEVSDVNKDGELIETTGSQVGSVAGVVMYDHGILILTGSWNMGTTNKEPYISANGNEFPKWLTFGSGMDIARNAANAGAPGNTPNTSYQILFSGTNEVPTLTMLAHAEKGEANLSSNPTFVDKSAYKEPSFASGSFHIGECTVKNIVKSPHSHHSASFEKVTYISKVGIYDEDHNLIGIATLANPVRKKEDRDYTFKIKVDF